MTLASPRPWRGARFWQGQGENRFFMSLNSVFFFFFIWRRFSLNFSGAHPVQTRSPQGQGHWLRCRRVHSPLCKTANDTEVVLWPENMKHFQNTKVRTIVKRNFNKLWIIISEWRTTSQWLDDQKNMSKCQAQFQGPPAAGLEIFVLPRVSMSKIRPSASTETHSSVTQIQSFVLTTADNIRELCTAADVKVRRALSAPPPALPNDNSNLFVYRSFQTGSHADILSKQTV